MFPVTRKFMREKMSIETGQMLAIPFCLLALDSAGGEATIPFISRDLIE